ncbi:serine dehydratase beta chain, partial [Streptomyces shenzhenensis]|uniref:serine dehydratase beta chain n=1 Tax=Streptomyces shenzhenensis TaxID=943815 RepID=UPI0016050A14
NLLGTHAIDFDRDTQLVLHRRRSLPYHANGMTLWAYRADGSTVLEKTYYSVGGGFVLDEDDAGRPLLVADPTPVRYPFTTGDGLLALTRETGLRPSDVMLANELSWRSEAEVRAGLLHIWSVMRECVGRGTHTDGVLPGGLRVRRRAAALRARLESGADETDGLHAMEWVTLAALAVNEENAAGGRVVTAPTNGAA